MQWQYLERVSAKLIAATFAVWQTTHPEAGVLALVCESEAALVVPLQVEARRSGTPLVGVVVPGLIVDGAFHRGGILLLAFPKATPCRIVPIDATATSAVEAVASLADFVATCADARPGADTLLLFLDGMTPNVASLLDALYLASGDQVHYAGTSVGSESFQPVPCIFDADHFVEGALLAMLLRDNDGPAIAHYYQGNVTLRVATEVEGNRIRTINGVLAFDAYCELIRTEYGIALDREGFYQYAVHFPFAFNRVAGEPLVRIPVAVEEDGSILCIGEVPQNALLGVVRAIEPGNLTAAREVGAVIAGGRGVGVLAIYCAGRLLHLGQASATAELKTLTQTIAPKPLVGVLSLGEIGNVREEEYPQFCNATIVALPWG